MNTQDLSIFRIPVDTDAWHRFRTTGLLPEDCEKYKCPPYASGLGSSECGTILGLQKKYRPCAAEYYQYKVGSSTPTQQTNRAMIRGKILEPIVAKIWMLYEGEGEAWVQNIMEYLDGTRETKKYLSVRNAKKYNAYFVNNKCPWLFSSLDYFAEKNTPGILDGRIHPDGFPVEVKTINTFYAKIWENGVPQSYIAQLNQEMICTNSNYGEIAVLFPDEFRFEIFPFYRDDALCKQIIYWGGEFWKKVLKAREAFSQQEGYLKKNDLEGYEHMKAIIDSGEPEPDDGEAYSLYIKERYKQIITSTPGPMKLYYKCQEDEVIRIYQKLLDEKRTGIQNQIMALLEETGAERIDFDALGEVTYLPNKNGARSVRFNMKVKPNSKTAEEEINKLNFKF